MDNTTGTILFFALVVIGIPLIIIANSYYKSKQVNSDDGGDGEDLWKQILAEEGLSLDDLVEDDKNDKDDL